MTYLLLALAAVAALVWWVVDLLRHPAVCPVCDGIGERGPGGGRPVPGKRVAPCRQCKGTKRTSRITGRAWKG